MPFLPREWVVWTCQTCDSVVNVSPSTNVQNRIPRCPYCQFTPTVVPERRAALEVAGVGLIGATETAGLDYLAAIANALIDLRNKYFAVNHVPDPIDIGNIPEKER